MTRIRGSSCCSRNRMSSGTAVLVVMAVMILAHCLLAHPSSSSSSSSSSSCCCDAAAAAFLPPSTTTTTPGNGSPAASLQRRGLLLLFASNKGGRRIVSAAADDNDTDDEADTPAAQPPRRRFGQTVHHAQKKIRGGGSRGGGGASASKTTGSSKNKVAAAAAATRNGASSKSVQKDRMWQSRQKSIEELETIMSSRWGTDLNAWTAQDVEDYDDYDENENEQEGQEYSAESGGSGKATERTAFRIKPVKDPWEKQEASPPQKKKMKQERSSSSDQSESSSSSSSSSFFFRDAKKDSTSPTSVNGKNNDKGDVMMDNEQPPPAQKIMKKGRLSVEHLIASKPAGGRGTMQQSHRDRDAERGGKDSTSSSSSSDDSGESSSFFFRSNAATSPAVSSDATTNTNTPVDEKPRKRKGEQPPKPLFDEEGKPLLLTLELAERNFRAYEASLSGATTTTSDEDATNGNDDVEEDFALFDDETNSNRLALLSASSGTSWQDLGITHPQLLENLRGMGCENPLSVQTNACREILSGNDENEFENKDVLIGTYTGSGKTLAFLIPIVQRLLTTTPENNKKNIRALIVAPGRELASQIVSVARELLQDVENMDVMLAIGGTAYGRNLEQIRKRKPTILVGTPGRLAELVVGRPGEKVGRLRTLFAPVSRRGESSAPSLTLVLDEFDALLEYKPHREPTQAILETLQRRNDLQSILCSATASDILDAPSQKLTRYLRPGFAQVMADEDDVLVTGGSEGLDGEIDGKASGTRTRVSRTVVHGVVHVPHRRFVLDTMRRILHTNPLPQQILIFVDNSRKVDRVVEQLERIGILAAPLHGGKGSDKMDRAQVSRALRDGYVGIVVATELAARGLDAPLLTHVINLDLPTDASHYAHRAGRCGRGGRPGVVINLTADPKDRKVPQKFASPLGIEMHTVDVRNGKLNVIDPSSFTLDA